MPCAFGDPYSESVVDERHEVLLKAAYGFARGRFLEVFNSFIAGQNECAGSVHVLDRLPPVWDDDTAKLLRGWLRAKGIKPEAFRKILAFLIERNDEPAAQVATDLVAGITAEQEGDFGLQRSAALELLSRDAIAGWKIVWHAAEGNDGFAQTVFATLAADPYSRFTSSLIPRLRDEQLADMYIWIARHSPASRDEAGFGMITTERALIWLGQVVLTELRSRGTQSALAEIGRIRRTLPCEPLDLLSKSTEELVRRNSWQPLSPAGLTDLVSHASKKAQLPPLPADTGLVMKPDLNLMRRIVLAVADAPAGVAHNQPSVDGYSRDQIGYQIYLLVDKGLARGINVTNTGNTYPQFLITGLTPNGHDFAELARNETRWSNAIAAAENAGLITLDHVRHLLASPPAARVNLRDGNPAPDHASAGAAPKGGRARRRGRPPKPERRDGIRSALNKHGETWRERLGEVFEDLDSQDVPLGDFLGMTIDLGEVIIHEFGVGPTSILLQRISARRLLTRFGSMPIDGFNPIHSNYFHAPDRSSLG